MGQSASTSPIPVSAGLRVPAQAATVEGGGTSRSVCPSFYPVSLQGKGFKDRFELQGLAQSFISQPTNPYIVGVSAEMWPRQWQKKCQGLTRKHGVHCTRRVEDVALWLHVARDCFCPSSPHHVLAAPVVTATHQPPSC